jgi:hypothetical protein
VLALHEIAHELRVKRLGGLFLKLDFEKAYDRVDWDFLREVLRRKGFSATMVHRLMQLVSGGQTAVNVNGEIGPFFRNARGVRQGDPLSPILFDFMVDALAAMLSRAKEAGHILGLVRHLIPGGITHLQYADDTMVMIEPSDEDIANLKLVLISFELMSGLKINLAKSEVVVVGTTPLEQERVARLLNCRLGTFPIKYLGLPLSNKSLRASDWEFLTAKVAKRVDPWQGSFLASAGRLELTNSCLSSLPLFAMSLFMLFDSTHAAFDKVRSRFFWEGVGDKRKYHMVDWATVCRPKEAGGLGILNTRHMNIALMLKWVWKLYHNADGLWAELIRAKYLGENDLFSPLVPTKGSQFWNSIQKVKWYFKLGAKHSVRNGKRTFFWLDWWLGTSPLRDRYPVLFSCCTSPFITVLGARDGPGWRLQFRRPFSLAETVEWDNLTRELDFTQASAEDDLVSWRLEASGDFTAKSLYCRLSQGAAVTHFREVWRTRVPPRIRVFLWQLLWGKLPCSLQVAKRKGPSNGLCALCGEPEDCDHIFFKCALARFLWAGVRELLHCSWNPAGAGDFLAISHGLAGAYRRVVWYSFAALAWALWNIRNKLTMEGVLIGKPADALFKMIVYMQQWRMLVKWKDRGLVDAAMDSLRRMHTDLAVSMGS